MAEKLPIAPTEYDEQNENRMRRNVEISLRRIETNISSNERKKTAAGSLALRRFQFMFMGEQS